ncbi:MAG: YggS family pyridoxal phosphate-dependent enzyme [Saprospiraceae bacterium]|nr:YggS family pyridoxal phosphate-dependent enzyme [Saprospiraceae bacterium]
MTALQQILVDLAPYNAQLVAVSKTKPTEAILQVYHEGHRLFGENRAQELAAKYEKLPKDIEWHMIGHLQRKKVKYIAPFVSMIHAIDTMSLLEEVNKRAGMSERRISVLLQVKIADEESKYGFDSSDLASVFAEIEAMSIPHVQIAGLMGMASFVEDQQQVSAEFATLKEAFDSIKAAHYPNDPAFRILSMGMSGDYKLALQAGSNMVRIGSLIFGAR